jgi:lipid-binding SYLF domain-containing protein
MKRSKSEDHKRTRLGVLFFTGALAVMFIVYAMAPAIAEDYSKQQQLVEKALMSFQEFSADPTIGWTENQAKRVKALLIVPQVLRGGFIFGGAGGSGVLLVRDEKTGKWSDPAFFTIGSASFGLQIGADASELVLLVMTTRGVESFYTSSFKLGGDVSIAAGPVGAGVKGATTPTLSVDMLSYTKAKGAYAGISLEGAGVSNSTKSNEAYYGKGTRTTDILVKRSATNPGAKKLIEAVTKATK